MATVSEPLEANLKRVFGNRHDVDRRQAIDEIYTEDVSFTGPDGTVIGRDALEARAKELLARAPGASVTTLLAAM